MRVNKHIGLDSQCLSYLIDAIEGTGPPQGDLAPEKIALFRIYLYTPGTLVLSPTVVDECAQIRAIDVRGRHFSYWETLFLRLAVQNYTRVQDRVTQLTPHHTGVADCQILAEAEDIGFHTLLTYDSEFLRRLGGLKSSVQLARPSDYWRQLAIPHGTTPDKIPDPTNPLAVQDWWRW